MTRYGESPRSENRKAIGLGDCVYVDALLARIRRGRDGHMVAVECLHDRVVNGPDAFMPRPQTTGAARLNALFHALFSCPGMLGAAQSVGDPALILVELQRDPTAVRQRQLSAGRQHDS